MALGLIRVEVVFRGSDPVSLEGQPQHIKKTCGLKNFASLPWFPSRLVLVPSENKIGRQQQRQYKTLHNSTTQYTTVLTIKKQTFKIFSIRRNTFFLSLEISINSS